MFGAHRQADCETVLVDNVCLGVKKRREACGGPKPIRGGFPHFALRKLHPGVFQPRLTEALD